MQAFNESMARLADKLSLVIAERKFAEMRAISHELKGLSLSFGCFQISVLCAEIEDSTNEWTDWQAIELVNKKLGEAIRKSQTGAERD